jgi:acyl-coenzyme A synthetase/AMP-(fatty) acid ligase
LAGGDALSVPHVKQVLERFDRCQLINGYGPTECTTFSVCWRVFGQSSIGMTVPIGRPVSNEQVYVLDRELEPVPVGVPGELYIGGDGLSRGYVNRPGLTAERFIANPFGKPGSRLYRTGDLVRYLPDGNLEYLGRLDRQLKVRGFRIEPGEIEAALLSHPDVRQAVVVAQPAAIGDKRLIAYVVGDSGLLPEEDQLCEYLKASLPEYMLPAAFVALDELPLTPNGKVDRSSLPLPEWRPARLRVPGTPRTPLERAVAEIWSEFLKIEAIRIHDDFFELGGTTLMFHETVTRIGERFGIDLDGCTAQKATIAVLVNRVRCSLINDVA